LITGNQKEIQVTHGYAEYTIKRENPIKACWLTEYSMCYFVGVLSSHLLNGVVKWIEQQKRNCLARLWKNFQTENQGINVGSHMMAGIAHVGIAALIIALLVWIRCIEAKNLVGDMEDKLFIAFLNWFMCSDPWPTTVGEHRTITAFLDAEAKRRGYENWVVAYDEIEENKQ